MSVVFSADSKAISPRFGRDTEDLLDEVASGDRARILASICGDSGAGKSALLDRLESEYRRAGWTVRRSLLQSADAAPSARSVVLIDDADQLSEASVATLTAVVATRDDDIIVTHGVGHHPESLRRLLKVVGRQRIPIALGVVAREELARHLHAAYGHPPQPARIEDVLEQTAALPWLVARTIAATDTHSTDILSSRAFDELDRDLSEWSPPVREVLLAIAVGFDPRRRMPAALRDSHTRLDDLIAVARRSGLITPAGRVVPIIERVLLEYTPEWTVRALQHELVDSIVDEGASLDLVATTLARNGFSDPRVARALERMGDQRLAADPSMAGISYRDGIAAGGAEPDFAARLAQVSAADGDLDGAARLVDTLFSWDDPLDLPRAADVAANVWAHRGMLARGAEIYRWVGPDRLGSSASRAAVAMFGNGDRQGAEGMLSATSAARSPTMVNAAVDLLAQGIRDSLDARTTRTLPALIHSSDMMTAAGEVVMLPDSPAAIAATVALHTGDLHLADSILDRAISGRQCGRAAQPRLLLLRAWSAMHSDRPSDARTAIEAATDDTVLTPRDDMLLWALEVGLARRADDAPRLVEAWQRARESILHVTIDLYSLLPFGELMIAGARLRDAERLEFHRAEAWALLARLGEPQLWAVPLRWAAIQAAILADRPGDLGPHAAALVRAASHSPIAAAFAAAGRAWITVLAENFDVAPVEAAARELAAVGMSWEGSRLAGHAAAHAGDRKDLARLLACARDVHPIVASIESTPATETGPSNRSSTPLRDRSGLSARERQVARLVLDGKTYWEIGETMFISPRTVEHHVARMRRRLGAETRSELLTRLRFAFDS